MKVAVYNGKELALVDMLEPVPTETQVKIHIKAAGICGTDLAIVNGDLPTPVPIVLGHEFAGEIGEVGENVDKSWLGKFVTSEINSNIDFDCYYCNRKLYTQCVSRKALGIDINGAFAEYIAVESYLLHEFPESLSFEEATFIEPLAAAYQTFETMPLEEHDKVITIFGMGKLGLLILQIAKNLGMNIIAVDGSEHKLELAKEFGAFHLINRLQTEDISQELKDLTSNLGSDIVVDATGNPNVLNDVVSSCRTRGKIHLKSTHGLATPINITDVVVRELTIYSSRCGPFEKAIEGLSSKKIQVKPLISKVFSLNEIDKAFASYRKSRDHIKTIIKI